MELGLSPDIKKKLKRFSAREAMFFWYRHYKLFFFLLFLLVLGFSAYQWYYSLHQYQWTEAEKKAYIESYFKETDFQDEAFRDLVGRLEERARRHEEPVSPRRDIFTGEYLP